MSGKGSSPRGEHRSSALWGTGNRGGESRSNALWGKGGRGLVTALCAVLVVAAPLAAGAGKSGNNEIKVVSSTYIDPILLAWSAGHPPRAESAAGTPGPAEADDLLGGGRHWRPL